MDPNTPRPVPPPAQHQPPPHQPPPARYAGAAGRPDAPPHRTRLSAGAVVGIVVASVLFLATAVGTVVGIAALASHLPAIAERAVVESESDWAADDEFPDRYTAAETAFSFPAALELHDGDTIVSCPAELELGCWSAAVVPEQECEDLRVTFAYSNDPDAPYGEANSDLHRADVEAGETVAFTFGDDAYEYGWVSDVACVVEPTAGTKAA